MKEMRTIEWKIYTYLKSRSLEQKWTSQSELQNYLSSIGIKVHTRQIRESISIIRQNETIQKIILTDYSKGYRIMCGKEEFDYLERRKISVLKMLKQVNFDIKKYNKNNQGRLTFSKSERDFIESLLKVC